VRRSSEEGNETVRIGEVSRRTGVSERMLRYYEQEGLLRPERTPAGYRDYGENEVQTATVIRALNASGLKLDSIKSLLPCVNGAESVFTPCGRVRDTLTQELRALDEKLRDLGESRRLVAQYLQGLAADRRTTPTAG
jgi:DNA-binding transcriptional MerR regulator